MDESRFARLLRWLVPAATLFAIGAWMYLAPEGALGKLDALGYAVCHRIGARSFQVDGRALPLCARCTGEFFTAAAALIFQVIASGKRSKLPSRGILAVLVVFFLAFGIDGSNSYLYLLKQTSQGALDNIPNLYAPHNTYRLFTGSGMGVALAVVLYPIINQTLWKTLDPRPALEWKSFGGLVALIAALDLLVLSESPIILYPVAYLSALGALALLTIVFTMLWLMMMRQDNALEHPRQLWLPFAAGLTIALLMMLGIDLFRLQLTGTWEGLPGLQG